MQRTNRSLVGQGSTTTLFYRELGVRWQAAGVMSAAALKVALSLQRKIIHRDHNPIWYRPPRALRSVSEMHGVGASACLTHLPYSARLLGPDVSTRARVVGGVGSV